ncbi:biotin--[acetyl-CoA-carboxylase] ligase [Propionibacterium freudenreichii]|uniref:biotin--[acetyl-CoA-carboxylase] ligase n=1 Tax=Propionibacterium freudenreichii TaxID=1744 RepID=UPI0022FD42AF|nr:biotin--[acetyl-CoA-carboxylase] ligase [Propionibacterium freudenreichii]
MPTTAPVDPVELEQLLGKNSYWGPIQWRPETGSTNDDLVALAKKGAATGLVVMSEHQVGGRARFDRVWQDTAGTSVATSVLVAPTPPPLQWGWLSLLVGVAVREGVENYTGAVPGRVTLKWPNDVLLDDRKICGILSERVGDRAVLGWGLNVSMSQEELPVPTGTSLLLAGLPHAKTPLMAAVLQALDHWFAVWQRRGEIREEYARVCATIGRRVTVHLDFEHPDRGSITGVATGVDRNGALVVDDDQGTRRVLTAGDVVHLR